MMGLPMLWPIGGLAVVAYAVTGTHRSALPGSRIARRQAVEP